MSREGEQTRATSAASLMAAVASIVIMFATDAHGAGDEWTAAVFVGAAHTQNSSITLIRLPDSTDVKVSPVVYRSASFEAPIYYGYRIGCFPGSRWIGIEGEFIHLKVIADTSRQALFTGIFKGEAVADPKPV